MRAVLNHIRSLRDQGKKGFAILVDPDKVLPAEVTTLAQRINQAGIDFVFVGGSLLVNDHIRQVVPQLRQQCQAPVVLFPGNVLQITDTADALLFLSLISGRNPEMLIGNHVLAAPHLKQSGMEVIPTGYMLIDTGRVTAVNYMSNTRPIPYDKVDIAACTAMAGELLGLQLIYLDGGSGAAKTISTEMISAVAGSIDIPLIVGGGIRSKKQAADILKAGADLIVIGNALEENTDSPLILDIPELIATF
ncbi:MAG: geranylgeranylglyceryl/heptaprenylglyceryl phosphate synthase [Bacteroidota bacterium]